MELSQFINSIKSIRLTEHVDSTNLFDILGINQKETLHSRLLSYLLIDSLRTDRFFWNNLIRKLAINDRICESLLNAKPEDVYINTEHSFDNSHNNSDAKNFIDIFISNSVCAIAFENKINAGEGTDQIIRYQKYLEARKEENRVIVYLTKNRDFPSSYIKNSTKLVCLSWLDVINCIGSSLNHKKPEALFVSIQNHFHNSFMKYHEEFEQCYNFFNENSFSYKRLVDNYDRCVKRQTKEWFSRLVSKIEEEYKLQFEINLIEDESIGRGRFTLTVFKNIWKPYNISIKVYRHGALGVFPCIEHLQDKNEFAIHQDHLLHPYINHRSFKLGNNSVFYFSKEYFQDNFIENQRKRWLKRNPILLDDKDMDKVISTVINYSTELDSILTSHHA
jgi:hypothetical protein